MAKKNMSAGWLAFSRKEKIMHVEYPSAEHWCWSGQNCKGKWGFSHKGLVVAVESSKGEKAGTERGEGEGKGGAKVEVKRPEYCQDSIVTQGMMVAVKGEERGDNFGWKFLEENADGLIDTSYG
ncbi:hypothetical protein BDZ45DRAFT_143044 [Acephala macrosclerotiorum]|nr:hypothetical protein BDZ45DRAFT_143044 [Acephala macrosclerotiorum]